MARVPQRRFAYLTVAVLLIAAAAGAMLFGWHEDDAPEYRLARVERGPIVSTVTASGTLAAVVTVQVGSQISGQLKEIYADFNSEVKAGELIARLDPATYDAKLKQAEANLALAQASVKTQRASVIKARSALTNTEKGLRRQRDRRRRSAFQYRPGRGQHG
jgi:HlyD family secretion protein